MTVDLAALLRCQLVEPVRAAAELAQQALLGGACAWLASRSHKQLDELVGLCLKAATDEDLASELCVLALLLLLAEGRAVSPHEPLGSALRTLMHMAQVEPLRRRGLVELDDAAFSLGTFDIRSIRLTAEGKTHFRSLRVLPSSEVAPSRAAQRLN